MKSGIRTLGKIFAVTVLSLACSGCDDPQVYGSVGVSSYSGGGGYYGGRYGGGTGMRTSVSIGGRIH
jgi:hypothetical protein